MTTDQWSTQDGCIISNFEIGFVLASGTIAAGDILKFSTTNIPADGSIKMQDAAGYCDGIAVAMKAAVEGETIPVLFHGVYKLTIAGSGTGAANTHQIFAGSSVVNSSGFLHATRIIPASKAGIASATGPQAFLRGNSHILGTALQHGNDTDEILVLIGRVC